MKNIRDPLWIVGILVILAGTLIAPPMRMVEHCHETTHADDLCTPAGRSGMNKGVLLMVGGLLLVGASHLVKRRN